MRPIFGEAVWKRSEILAATGWVQESRRLISNFLVSIRNKARKKALLGLDRCHQCANADDFHHSFHVVGKNMRAHFGTDPFQGTSQEMAGPHSVLQRTERMLNESCQ